VSALVEVGSYTRELGAGVERLFENALDWEHLPHLHDGSFSGIRVIEHGPTGWRAEARLTGGRGVTLDLRLDEAGWVTRSFAGERVTTEICTRAEATGPDSCRVHVRFLVADLPKEKRLAIGDNYRALYARLYDEDERMMIARAEAISRGPGALKERRVATLADGTTAEVPVFCPHQGLPLDAEPDSDGVITCPWHGYRVDIRTGRCTAPFSAVGAPPAS
jgi:nitrite reductase/ring-hydroxylating ferredoxin subunit